MAFGAYRVAVDSTRDSINAARAAGEYLVLNAGAQSCYIGDVTVTDTTGFKLAAGGAVTLNLQGEERAYAICAAGESTTLHVLTE